MAAAEDNGFNQGLKALQEKKWEEASGEFAKALVANPNDPAILYNLGLAQFRLGKKGAAVGYWRKALAVAPGARAPEEALEQLQEKFHFARLEKSAAAQTLHLIFNKVGWDVWLAVLAVLLAFAGWRWLGYFQTRKVALASEDAEVPPISVGLWILTFLLALVLAAVAGKCLDAQKARATAIASVELKSAPSGDGATLASVSEGAELQILSRRDEWLQVTTGDGNGGWVKQTDVIEARRD